MVKAWHLTFIVMQDREATRRGSRTGLILQNEIGRTKIALGTDFIPGTIEKVRILSALCRQQFSPKNSVHPLGWKRSSIKREGEQYSFVFLPQIYRGKTLDSYPLGLSLVKKTFSLIQQKSPLG